MKYYKNICKLALFGPSLPTFFTLTFSLSPKKRMNPVAPKKKPKVPTGRNPFGEKKREEKRDKENKAVWLDIDQVANLLSIDYRVALQFLRHAPFPWDSACSMRIKGPVYRKDQVLRLFELFKSNGCQEKEEGK